MFVNTGDGDCCSIGAAHWIHAIRYNMNMTVILHDNHVYGLTKKQASPTSPIGFKSNTTPRGSLPRGAEPAHRHARRAERLVRRAGRGLDPGAALRHHRQGVPAPRLLVHPHHPALPRVPAQDVRAVAARPAARRCCSRTRTASRSRRSSSRIYKNQREHDPLDIDRAREIASCEDPIPVGILYHNPEFPATRTCATPAQPRTAERIRAGLEAELDKVTIWPDEARRSARRLTHDDPARTSAMDMAARFQDSWSST